MDDYVYPPIQKLSQFFKRIDVYLSKDNQVSTLGVKNMKPRLLYIDEIKFTCQNGI
jgi:hypothetical protein